jgi:uncharacterized protein (DUF433 family)
MTKAQLKIIIYAVKSRLKKGESFEDIIASYPKLTESDIAEVKSACGIEDKKE